MQGSSAITISELIGSSFSYTNRAFHPREPPKTMFRVHTNERHGENDRTLPLLIFRKLPGNIVEFAAISQLCKSLFLFGMLFTLAKCVRRSCVWQAATRHQLTKMCRTLMDVAALSFPLPDSPPSLPLPLPLPAEDDFDGMLIDAEINAATCRFGNMICMQLFPIWLDDGAKTFPPSARLARCETRNQRTKTEGEQEHPVRRHSSAA